MCARFMLMFDPEVLRAMLGLGGWPDSLTPNQNILPGQGIPVIIDAVTRKVELFRWGLVPGWAKDPSIGFKTINARAETLAEKPSFRGAFARRRCLIPAGGFYEWKQEGTRKQPFLFQMRDKKPFTFAGLWEIWQDGHGNQLLSCTIITTAPNSMISEYHDRMPAILNESDRWRWLENIPPDELSRLLRPFPAEEMAVPVRVDPMVFRNSAVLKKLNQYN